MTNGILRIIETKHDNWNLEHSGEDHLYRIKSKKTGRYLHGSYTSQYFAHQALDEYMNDERVTRPGPGRGKKKEKVEKVEEIVSNGESTFSREEIASQTMLSQEEIMDIAEKGIPEDAVKLTEE